MSDREADDREEEPERTVAEERSEAYASWETCEPIMKDTTTKYRNPDGKVRSFFQIAMLGVKEGADIEQTDEGFLVDGEHYTPIADEEGTDEAR